MKNGTFFRLARVLEVERLAEKADTLEAQILAVVIGLESEVDRGILPVKRITEDWNEDRSEKFRVTPHKVGRRLSAMGFKKARIHSGASAIIWDGEKVRRMKEA
ncbi:MAG: hypothetical protein GTO29_13250, partial [Candidatus Latescibacteria bacterium]|nr:hypothetical protein [Candidatus Latescibacterota bacterium]NIO56561.1 hypothetical protein [Candidatus Latescibacterota bacterium]